MQGCCCEPMIAAIHNVVCGLLGVCLQIIIYSRFFYFSLLHIVLRTALQLCIAIRAGVYVANSFRSTRLSYGWSYSPSAPLFFDKSCFRLFSSSARKEATAKKKIARLTNDCDFEKASGTYVDAGRGAVTCYLSSNDNTQGMGQSTERNNIIAVDSILCTQRAYAHLALFIILETPNPMSCICIHTQYNERMRSAPRMAFVDLWWQKFIQCQMEVSDMQRNVNVSANIRFVLITRVARCVSHRIAMDARPMEKLQFQIAFGWAKWRTRVAVCRRQWAQI